MKKYLLTGILLCAVVLASGCTMYGYGSGKVINQTKDVKGVNQVSLSGVGTVVLQQGNQETLTIEAEDNIVPHIQSKVDGNKLSISYDTNTPTPTKDVRYILTVKDMNSITISGAGKIQSTSFKTKTMTIAMDGAGNGNMAGLDLEKLIVNISGAGKIIMAGKTTEQTVTIAGAGNYQAKDLESKTATITINGAGNGAVKVSDVLNAFVDGAGEIQYLGNPQVNKQISGAGNIKQITS